MKVVSLFDGIAGAAEALKQLGIIPDLYFACEVDKYAIQIAMKNHPYIIQLGDVKKINFSTRNDIDLLIGGSPCQGFSFAGKQLNFNDERSKLFFEYVRALKEIKPKYFLLENVKMKKEYQDIISGYLGVKPIEINSSLLTAQNRKRLYWTNIPGIKQPQDRHIYLKDIIKNGYVDKEKSFALDASYYKGSQNGKLYLEKSRRQIVFIENKTILHNLYGGFKEKFPRVFNDKSPTIRTSSGGGHIPSVFTRWLWENNKIILKNRLLYPTECERLQTFPDDYTEGISATQRYKALGNSFTVEVIKHILRNML